MKPILLSLIIGIFTSTACAQYDPGATAMIAQNNMMYNSTIQSFVNQNIINDLAYGNTKGAAARTKTSGTANRAGFRFIPAEKTSVKVKRDIIDNFKKKNPKIGETLEKALSKLNNPFPKYVQSLTSLGLDVQHDYADAFTAYLLGMWRIANGMNANPNVTQINSVRDQVAATMDVSNWNNTQKQEAAEYMIYELIFANEPYEGSRKDGDQKLAKLDSDRIYNRFLRQNNMDLRKMEITSSGLVIVK